MVVRLVSLAVVIALLFAGCSAPADTISTLGGGSDSGALLSFGNVTVSPLQPQVGEPIVFKSILRNEGGQAAHTAVQLLIDGIVEDEKTFRVASGLSEPVVLSFTPVKAGKLTAMLATSVLDESERTKAFSAPISLTALVPADIAIIQATLDQKEVEIGEEAIITAVVKNKGGTDGSKPIRLQVDGQVKETRSISLAAGKEQTVVFEYTTTERGTFTVAVNEVSAGTLKFYMPATFNIISFIPSTSTPDNEDTFTMSYRLQNIGDVAGSTEVELTRGLTTVGSRTETISAGGAVDGSIEVKADWKGSAELTLSLPSGTSKASTISVRAPNLEFDSVTKPSNSDWDCPNWATTKFTIRNTGLGTARALTYRAYVDDEQKYIDDDGDDQGNTLATIPVDIPPGETWTSPKLKIFHVTDRCGSDDTYDFYIRVYGSGASGDNQRSDTQRFTI